jgi:hypothetical protein
MRDGLEGYPPRAPANGILPSTGNTSRRFRPRTVEELVTAKIQPPSQQYSTAMAVTNASRLPSQLQQHHMALRPAAQSRSSRLTHTPQYITPDARTLAPDLLLRCLYDTESTQVQLDLLREIREILDWELSTLVIRCLAPQLFSRARGLPFGLFADSYLCHWTDAM